MPGRSDFARTGFVVDAMEEGKGTGDSRIETAAVDGVPMEDVPRTMTWR